MPRTVFTEWHRCSQRNPVMQLCFKLVTCNPDQARRQCTVSANVDKEG